MRVWKRLMCDPICVIPPRLGCSLSTMQKPNLNQDPLKINGWKMNFPLKWLLKKRTFLSLRGCTGSGVDPQLWHQFLSSQLYFQRYQPNLTHCCCFTLQVTRSHEELQVVGWMFWELFLIDVAVRKLAKFRCNVEFERAATWHPKQT